MAKDKKKDNSTEQLNALMSTYRDSVLPTPILLWRTEGKTVAAAQLSEEEFDEVMAVLQP